jgi:hypothetical protein
VTHKATTPTLQELWAKIANETLERTGDEGRAIQEANAVVGGQADDLRRASWSFGLMATKSGIWQ